MDQQSGPRATQLTRSARITRQVLIAVVAAAVLVVAVLAWRGNRDTGSPSTGPMVGGDLHAVAVMDGRLFVSGHEGAGWLDGVSGWKQISSLDGKDGMGWASTPSGIYVGGHAGLFFSDDLGVTFARATAKLPFTDVHAAGAAANTVYVASPQAGLYVSLDGGKSFDKRSDAGTTFMGSIAVDPKDPNRAIAPDMQNGAVITTDGGTTWNTLGGPGGTMSVAWNPADQRQIAVIGMNGAGLTSDGGRTWADLDVPGGTSAATFDSGGRLIVAALSGQRASVFRQSGNGWSKVR